MGRHSHGGDTNLLFGIIVAKNLHENEKNGLRGEVHVPRAP